jgi:hypothetical protein
MYLEFAKVIGQLSVVRTPTEAALCLLGAPPPSAGVELFSAVAITGQRTQKMI